MNSRMACVGMLSCAVILTVTTSYSADNTLSDYEKRAGWKLLFDGTTTAGWRNYKKDTIGSGWVVKDGTLSRAANGAGDIVTTEEYDSFELSLEYNISKGGNSGIMFHVQETEPAPWQTGPEIQVQDNVDGHDPQKAGWLYQLYPASPEPLTNAKVDATRPAGSWNQVQVLITPVGCEINVNGYRYSRFQKGSADWNQRVAKSKFAQFPNFGKPTKGFICLQDHGNLVSYRNVKIRKLSAEGVPPEPIDGTLPLKVELAFPKLKWAGWEPEDADGRPQQFRPILLTNAGDGSNRIFVASQQGVIHQFGNSDDVAESKIFLDISDRVMYKDSENEEGLLGLAFHPKFKQNGELFVYYTSRKARRTSVISRFKVSQDSANLAKADSEEVLLEIPQPFWNHNGGTLAFGPDGYLYVGLGDGGAANDPMKNAQNLETLLGSILRLDVDRKDTGKNYAIPQDNPFVGHEKARPEIFAYGLRNIWRMSFDRETGDFWVADVGQNLWEEINIVTKGGNYGWSLREGTHPFGTVDTASRTDLIAPIWEYDHQVGASVTGGHVYRGKNLPELVGKYIYADYITGKIWALKYDGQTKKVVSNEAIPTNKIPVISFGEDEAGEVYFTVVTATGQGIFKFTK